jgi:hypothetical protein
VAVIIDMLLQAFGAVMAHPWVFWPLAALAVAVTIGLVFT